MDTTVDNVMNKTDNKSKALALIGGLGQLTVKLLSAIVSLFVTLIALIPDDDNEKLESPTVKPLVDDPSNISNTDQWMLDEIHDDRKLFK